MDLFSVLSVLSISILVYLFFCIQYVPENHVIVCVNTVDGFRRILKCGYNLKGLFEYDVIRHWGYINSKNETTHINGSALQLTKNSVCDLMPSIFKTPNKKLIIGTITFSYGIKHPENAIFASKNPLNLLCFEIRKIIQEMIMDFTTNVPEEIENIIKKRIEDFWCPVYGLNLESCKVKFTNDELRIRELLNEPRIRELLKMSE